MPQVKDVFRIDEPQSYGEVRYRYLISYDFRDPLNHPTRKIKEDTVETTGAVLTCSLSFRIQTTEDLQKVKRAIEKNEGRQIVIRSFSRFED